MSANAVLTQLPGMQPGPLFMRKTTPTKFLLPSEVFPDSGLLMELGVVRARIGAGYVMCFNVHSLQVVLILLESHLSLSPAPLTPFFVGLHRIFFFFCRNFY